MSILIKGYDNKIEIQDWLNTILVKPNKDYVYHGIKIEKPTYEEIKEYQEKVKLQFMLNIESIRVDVNAWLGTEDTENIVYTITNLLLECKSSGITDSILKNLYIRMMIALKYRFNNLIKDKGPLLYVGKPDKYEFVILTLLMNLGATVIIVDFDNTKEIELIIENKFEIKDGNIRESLELTNNPTLTSNNIVNENKFSKCTGYTDYLNIVNENIGNRKRNDVWEVIHLEIAGVMSDESLYPEFVNSLMTKTKALLRDFVVFENEIMNPTFEENLNFDNNYKIKGIRFEDLLVSYPVINNIETIQLLNSKLQELMQTQEFLSENKKNNHIKVIYIWLIRYLDMFYKKRTLDNMPLLICWGKFNNREEEFISLLSLLPIDIVHFSPNELDIFSIALGSGLRVRLGYSSDAFVNLPKNILPTKVKTVAYNAERELDTLLYDGTSAMYRPNQFRNIEPLTLKTTYDEIGILWNQEAKYRSSFEAVGNLVKVGTIFAKVNGIPYDNKDEYLLQTKSLINEETKLYQSLPFTEEVIDQEWSNFVRQTVYKNNIEFDKIRKSKYYKYGVYSLETQELIIQKIEQLIELKWCNQDVTNLLYQTIEVLFDLPTDIVQLIHSYNFTEKIPKLLIFSGGMETCSLEDSIVIMFLKLIGFDILILAPTGYQLIENYIDPSLYNNINVGSYEFSLDNYDLTLGNKEESKVGFFKTIFEILGGK